MTADLDPAEEQLARRQLTRLIDAIDADTPVADSPDPGARRRSSNGVTRALAAVAAAAVAAGSVALVSRAGDGADQGPRTALSAVDPATLSEPAGSWSQAADPPFSSRVRSFAGTLSDGRVLVWGGEPPSSDPEPALALDGGIYDPETDEWTAIPPAPLATPVISNQSNSASLAGDRLAVITASTRSDGSGFALSAAVYDVAERRWYAAPAQDRITFTYDGVAWDGETLTLVRVDRGDRPQVDSASGDPVTLRWRPGDPAWSTGAPAPLSTRFGSGTAFDGTRLAVWGGTTSGTDAPAGADPGASADGAVYDLATDTWTQLPAAPLTPRIHPVVAWSNGRLLVCCGIDRLRNVTGEFSDLAAFSPSTGTWETLPESPGTGAYPAGGDGGPAGRRYVDGDPTFVLVGGHGRPYFLSGDGWEEAPFDDLHTVGGVVIAANAVPSQNNPDLDHFAVQVRTGPDDWIQAAAAPFGDRTEPTIVTTGTKLLVIGGYDESHPDPPDDTWILDLSAD